RAEEEAHDEYTNRTADVRYQNDYGIYEADWFDMDGNTNYVLQASGGIGYIDSTAFLSRPITDSFAKIKTGGLPGVRVSYFGNEVARTDESGEAIVPVVRSFSDNRIGIEKDDIPIEYGIPALSLYINPPYRSGAIVSFDIKKEQGFYGKVFVETGGVKKPVEYSIFRLFAADKAIDGLVGKDGEFYFEDVSVGAYQAKVFFNGKECVFNVTIPESAEVMVNIGELVCVMPSPDPSVAWVPRQPSPLGGEGVKGAAVTEAAPLAKPLEAAVIPSVPVAPETPASEEEALKADAPPVLESAEVILTEPFPSPQLSPARGEGVKEQAEPSAQGQTVQEAAEAAQSEALAKEKAAKIAPVVRGATPFSRVIHFRFASDTPVKWDAPALKELSLLARVNPNLKAIIRGYTDSLGSDEYNKALAGRRVAFVKSYLMTTGIKEEQIRETVGMGETHPVCDTPGRECRQANRRVEVLLLLK
ncbi:MAG: OmpA family protein, partial [Deltaproteobacteria bacterium]